MASWSLSDCIGHIRLRTTHGLPPHFPRAGCCAAYAVMQTSQRQCRNRKKHFMRYEEHAIFSSQDLFSRGTCCSDIPLRGASRDCFPIGRITPQTGDVHGAEPRPAVKLPILPNIPANISSLMARCTPRGPSFFFSFEIGHTRRSYRVFDQHRRPSGEGLAFGHPSCDKKSSASRRNQLTTWHPSGQRLAGVCRISFHTPASDPGAKIELRDHWWYGDFSTTIGRPSLRGRNSL
jgi:hypothetical protein